MRASTCDRRAVEFICEWTQVDDLETALEQVTATACIGATHAKWQIFQPDKLAGRDATRYWDESLGGNDSQHDMFADFGCLTESEWRQVADACDSAGVEFMATPFDLDAVGLLESVGVKAFKIASGDITYRPLIQKVAATGKRIYLSTGASTQPEIARALKWAQGADIIPLACDLVYPCEAKDASLARQIYGLRHYCHGVIPKVRVGYSDHTREVVTGAVAVALGATVLEKHITLDPRRGRPDDKMALTVDEACRYVRMANQAAELIAPVKGDPQAPAREGARRSAHAARDLAPGQILVESDVAWLRPAPENSISPAEDLTGRVLLNPVTAGERITPDALA